jgi:hypothetical protein
MGHGQACYGWLAVLSDVDDEGFVLNVDGGMVQVLPCYIEASTMELGIMVACDTQGG